MTTRILVADDHKIMREGLRSLIEQQDDMEVVAEADNGRTAVELARELSPDVVIMDVNMPELDGIEATRLIISGNFQIKVLALSMYSNRRFVTDMIKAGVSGYLPKECAFGELIRAIRAVLDNEIYLSSKITNVIIDGLADRSTETQEPGAASLTDRECEVLRKLAEGKTTKEIALHIGMSTKTVEACRRQIMDKLNVHSLPELTKYAIRKGLTTLDT